MSRDDAPNFRDVDSCSNCVHITMFPSRYCKKHDFNADEHRWEAFMKRCDDWKDTWEIEDDNK
jgi:hypothetical protein